MKKTKTHPFFYVLITVIFMGLLQFVITPRQTSCEQSIKEQPETKQIEVEVAGELARVTCYNDFGTMASGMITYPGAVAVSDRSIPLGTEIYVEGYGIMTIEDRTNIRFAEIKPMTIDIYMNISREECLIFGVQHLSYKLL